MDKNEVLKILETAKEENGEVPMRLVRQAFEKLSEPCEDAVSREAVGCLLYELYESCTSMDELVSCMESNIKILPSVTPEHRWIPCSERLPEEGERVLATHLGGVNPNNQVIEHIYQRGKFTCGWDMDMNVDSPTFGQRYMGEVIAWMPLPEPYRGEKNENRR